MNGCRLQLEAEQELAEAAAYYEQQSLGLGNDFLQEVLSGMRLIAEAPERYPKHGKRTRRFLVNRFPYFIIFTIHENRPTVVAVAHCRREPNYWRKRIS